MNRYSSGRKKKNLAHRGGQKEPWKTKTRQIQGKRTMSSNGLNKTSFAPGLIEEEKGGNSEGGPIGSWTTFRGREMIDRHESWS